MTVRLKVMIGDDINRQLNTVLLCMTLPALVMDVNRLVNMTLDHLFICSRH